MNTMEQGILGIQLTLVGLYLVTYFEGVSSLPLIGLLLGTVGTVVAMVAVLGSS